MGDTDLPSGALNDLPAAGQRKPYVARKAHVFVGRAVDRSRKMATAFARQFMTNAPTAAALSLIAAIGGPADLWGAPKTLGLVRHALEHASLSGVAVAPDWLLVIESFSDYCTEVLADRSLDQTIGRALAGAIQPDNKVYGLFGAWTRPLIESPHHAKAMAALGRALIAAASRKTVVQARLVSGVLRLTRDNRKINDHPWSTIVADFPTTSRAAARLMIDTEGPAAQFLADLRKVCDATLDPPPAEPLEQQRTASRQQDGQHTDRPTSASNCPPEGGEPTKARGDSCQGQPLTLQSRLAAAHYEVFGPKLGLSQQWDRLPPKALARLTRQLTLNLDPGTEGHALSVLAITSLISATPAKSALRIPLEPKPGIDIRLDINAGHVLWSYEAFCAASSSTSPLRPDHQPVPEKLEAAGRWFPVPLPAKLAKSLRRLRAIRPEAQDLGSLLCVQSDDMEAYGTYLRGLGDEAFPPYPARFARSIGVTYVELLNSDLAAASLGQYFAAAAPSTMRYFGPSTEWIQRIASEVYHFLGLGEAEAFSKPTESVGSPRMLPTSTTSVGWSRLTAKLNLLTLKLFEETDPYAVLRLASEANAVLAAALVVSTGHRGSRLERLTWRALLAHPVCMSYSDKLGESPPRAIPLTAIATNILAVLKRVAHRAYSSAAEIDRREHRAASEDPAFVCYTVRPSRMDEPGVVTAEPIESAAVAALVRECFGGEINAGRHVWITAMGMALVDRWLVRAVAGHGTEATQPMGAQIDVPMLHAMAELRDSMNQLFAQIFGTAQIDLHAGQPECVVKHGLLVRSGLERPARPSHGVVNPNAVLRPPTPDVLADADLVDEIRMLLASGKCGLSKTASLALHLMLFEPVPDIGAAIDIALSPGRHLRRILRTNGVEVDRQHFTHKLWLPLSPPTLCALAQMPAPTPTTTARHSLGDEILDWLLSLRPAHGTPRRASAEQVLERLVDSWRRLNLPPSLHALVHPYASPPVPSLQSLRRLAGWATGEAVHQPLESLSTSASQRRYKRGEELRAISAILGKYSATDKSLGAKPRRAAEAIDALSTANPDFSPLCQSIVKVYVAELRDSVNDAPGSLKVSSLATCNSWLMRGFATLDPAEDLTDLDDEDWGNFCLAVRHVDQPSRPQSTEAREGALFALTRLLRRIAVVYPESGTDLLAHIGERTTHARRDSASAVLLLPPDFERMNEAIDRAFAERPIDQAMLRAQVQLMERVSARTGETGALAANALTADLELIFEDNGFGTAKSRGATRVIELDEGTGSQVGALSTTVRALGAKHLFRADVGDVRVSSFESHSTFLLRLTKLVTGDDQARRHSARAHALQRNTWPGWQECAASLFTQEASSTDCLSWAASRFSARHRTNAAKQAVAAGHAGLQAGHGYYLSGWPLVATVVLRGLLTRLPPGSKVVEQVGLSHGALRQARSRAKAKGRNLDAWQWLAQRVSLPAFQDLHDANLSEPSAPPMSDLRARPAASTEPLRPASQEIDISAAVRYVLQRALDAEPHIAMARADLPQSHALALDHFLPCTVDVLAARRRVKGEIGGRALAADRQRAASDQAAMLLNWLLTLDAQDRTLLQLLACDDRAALLRHAAVFRTVEYWERIVAHMPVTQALRIRFGQRHLLADEQLALEALSPAITVGRDRDRGQVPCVLLTTRGADDRVASARDTSLLRLTALAIQAVDRMTTDGANVREKREIA